MLRLPLLGAGVLALILALALPTPTLAQRSSRNRLETLFVGPNLVDCVGVAPRQCLSVRRSPSGPSQNFFETIKGFKRVDGTSYVLRVAVSRVRNPPADASSLRYRLVRILSATPGPKERIETLYVGPREVDCQGLAPRKCLAVSRTRDGPKENFFSSIEGFNRVDGTSYVLSVAVTDIPNPPADGSSLRYVLREILEETPETPTERVETLYVGPREVDCQGVGPRKCLLVRTNPDGAEELFYDFIEGFERVDGTEYVLSVGVTDVPNPPADGSSLRYRLIRVIKATPTSPY